ncbi:MAG: hypothetical protein HQL47_03610 [Gammaproteobacteria bacterium]|nr:hypothetical protein [Gammaproteobacteria bacterium]
MMPNLLPSQLSNRLARFFYGTPNLAGMALALLGLGLLFSGLIKSYWWLIVAGLYGVGYLGTPQRAEEVRQLDDQLEMQALLQAFGDFLKRVHPQLSAPVLAQLEQFKQTAEAIIQRIERLDQGSDTRHAVRQTLAHYLPELIHDYLQLPPAFARLHPVRAGMTPRQLLLQQLELLNRDFSRILNDIHSEQLDRLEAHGQFLRQRFRHAEAVFETPS